ncbi:tRNA (adenosine(37)-N6)-threonylcarbamoyltransferase complex transferase subunit TsaD [Candidatus Peregrinibacteria bacterium CG08_land_8_20_14_0_20_41_10]|nr:MAG: tRNA (adenosine(37)-N6)-threonylcarbamoyltransferase complex transferase subunit TsaD [Candidatus Peregrinibacteria bacterium CG08_land_8_20_14_0_20_41_10]
MLILGIDTSCDDTSVSVVKDGREVLANVIFSQNDLHQMTGGVVPEVAAREHTLKIIPALEKALKEAGVDWSKIDAIAVTRGPGLMGSLLVGTVTASILSLVLNKPLIPVQHIVGHIYSNWLEGQRANGKEQMAKSKWQRDFEFPIVILTVSGGHNELVLMRDHHNFKVIGETLDDAAGEAFDKVARILGLGYPGGPAIFQASAGKITQDLHFPRAWLENSLNFSFSGLKTHIKYLVDKHGARGLKDQQFVRNVAYSFQEAVASVLAKKLIQAAMKYKVKVIHLAGGVAANLRLRQMIAEKATQINLPFFCPVSLKYCTDNAAMIAAAGYFWWQKRNLPQPQHQTVHGKSLLGKKGSDHLPLSLLGKEGSNNPSLSPLTKGGGQGGWKNVLASTSWELGD